MYPKILDIFCSEIVNKISIGPSFCQVVKIAQLVQEIPSITWGAQKWRGGRPIFIYSPTNTNSKSSLLSINLEAEPMMIEGNRIIEEPIA